MSRLGALLGVRSGEGRVVALLALHSFLVGLSTSLFETAAESLFLARWGADQLALVYLGWAIAVPLGGLLYSRLQGRFHLTTVWGATVLAITCLDVLFAGALHASSSPWVPFGMMVARDLFWTLMLMEFWDLAGWLLDLQQAKRLFGLVGGGEVAGGICAGLAVGPLLRVMELPELILVTGTGYFACFLLLRALVRHRPARAPEADGEGDAEASPRDLRALFRVRYVALVLLVPVAYTLAYDFLEYAYLGQAEVRYRDDPEAMASFLGAVLACWQTLALLGRALVSGRVLLRFGLWAALFVLPAAIALGGAGLLVLGLTAASPALVFWPVVALKVLDAVVRSAIDKPSYLVLFQVLAQELRVRVHAFQESISEPLTAGVSGLALLGATALLGGAAITAKVGAVALLLVLIGAGWLLLIAQIRPEYDRTLVASLAEGELSPSAVVSEGTPPPRDPAELPRLLARLDAPDLEVRRAAVQALALHGAALEPHHGALHTVLAREVDAALALPAQAPERAAALEVVLGLLVALHPGSMLPLARARLDDPERRAHALELIERTLRRDVRRTVRPLLHALDVARSEVREVG